MLALIKYLRWRDLEGSRVPVDEDSVRRIARACLEAVPRGGRPDRNAVERRVDTEFVAQWGSWIAGWNWAASEPGGGGPVRAYCCARDSLLQGQNPVEASVDRIVAATKDWQAFLREVDVRFETLRDQTQRLSIGEGAELAARELLPFVLERTSAEDAWYSTFSTILTWFLESEGHEHQDVAPQVTQVISGRFESWTEPEQATVDSAVSAIAKEIERVTESDPEQVDALTRWRKFREEALMPRSESAMRFTVQRDAHREFISRVDGERSNARAQRMYAALQACREAAKSDEPIDLTMLSRWQALVLGVDHAPTRSGPAFAKGGRERYGWKRSTMTRFEDCLREATNPDDHPTIRAARAYLDVCFFHPFEDGNARSARLVLDFILMRAGLALHTCEPLFVVSRSVVDKHDVSRLLLVLEQLTGMVPEGGLEGAR